MAHDENPVDAIYHEIMLHFPEIDKKQAIACAESAAIRIDTRGWGYALGCSELLRRR